MGGKVANKVEHGAWEQYDPDSGSLEALVAEAESAIRISRSPLKGYQEVIQERVVKALKKLVKKYHSRQDLLGIILKKLMYEDHELKAKGFRNLTQFTHRSSEADLERESSLDSLEFIENFISFYFAAASEELLSTPISDVRDYMTTEQIFHEGEERIIPLGQGDASFICPPSSLLVPHIPFGLWRRVKNKPAQYEVIQSLSRPMPGDIIDGLRVPPFLGEDITTLYDTLCNKGFSDEEVLEVLSFIKDKNKFNEFNFSNLQRIIEHNYDPKQKVRPKLGDILKASQLRLKNYRVLRKLGEGTFKTVYLAHHELTDKDYALVVQSVKELKEKAAEHFASRGKTAYDNCIDEAQKLARVNGHPNIPLLNDLPTYDKESDLFYWAAEIIDETLQSRLDRSERVDVIPLARGVAHALAEAEKHGLVHGDIKPENIGYVGDVVKVLDWGLCSFVPRERADVRAVLPYRLTRAPEIFDGGSPTHQSDMWAFGMLLYRVITGEYLFTPDFEGTHEEFHALSREEKSAYEQQIKQKIDEYAANHKVLEERVIKINKEYTKRTGIRLGDVIQHCLAPDSKDRYHNFQEVLDAIEPTVKRRKWWKWASILPLVLAGSIGIIAAQYKWERDKLGEAVQKMFDADSTFSKLIPSQKESATVELLVDTLGRALPEGTTVTEGIAIGSADEFSRDVPSFGRARLYVKELNIAGRRYLNFTFIEGSYYSYIPYSAILPKISEGRVDVELATRLGKESRSPNVLFVKGRLKSDLEYTLEIDLGTSILDEASGKRHLRVHDRGERHVPVITPYGILHYPGLTEPVEESSKPFQLGGIYLSREVRINDDQKLRLVRLGPPDNFSCPQGARIYFDYRIEEVVVTNSDLKFTRTPVLFWLRETQPVEGYTSANMEQWFLDGVPQEKKGRWYFPEPGPHEMSVVVERNAVKKKLSWRFDVVGPKEGEIWEDAYIGSPSITLFGTDTEKNVSSYMLEGDFGYYRSDGASIGNVELQVLVNGRLHYETLQNINMAGDRKYNGKFFIGPIVQSALKDGDIFEIVLDPHHKLNDVYRANNSTKFKFKSSDTANDK